MSSRETADWPLTFIRLNTQFENAGDCLINRELVRLAAARSDVCLDARGCPPDFAQQVVAGLPPERFYVPRWSFYGEMLRQRLLRRRCYWFLMPGAVTGAGGALGSWRSLLRDLPLRVASLIGVRACQVGASFGGLTEEFLETWHRRRSWLFRLSPRDTASVAYLQSCGIVSDPVIPDLSFHLFGSETKTLRDERGPGQLACFSFRTDQYSQQSEEVEAVARAIWRNTRPNTSWSLMVQVARDLAGMEILREKLTASGMQLAPSIDLHGDVEGCLAFYRQQSLVVSNRLHALLMGASQGARILAVAEGPGGDKLTGLLHDLGLQAAIVDPRNLSRAGTSAQPGLLVDGLPQREQLRLAFDELFRSDNSTFARNGRHLER